MSLMDQDLLGDPTSRVMELSVSENGGTPSYRIHVEFDGFSTIQKPSTTVTGGTPILRNGHLHFWWIFGKNVTENRNGG